MMQNARIRATIRQETIGEHATGNDSIPCSIGEHTQSIANKRLILQKAIGDIKAKRRPPAVVASYPPPPKSFAVNELRDIKILIQA